MPGHVMIIAGETSGDALGADLMQALRRHQSDIMVTGIGGPKMTGEGMSSIFPMSEIAVMGLKEILPRLPQLFKRVDEAVAHALATEPDVMVLIDSPEFNHRVARRVKAKRPEAKIICYVAPHVWAWRRGRARKMKNYFDAVMAFCRLSLMFLWPIMVPRVILSAIRLLTGWRSWSRSLTSKRNIA